MLTYHEKEQASNERYRMFNWRRKGAQGNTRRLKKNLMLGEMLGDASDLRARFHNIKLPTYEKKI